jgi:hypothetical protein
MALPLFSLTAPDEHGVNHSLASFSSLRSRRPPLLAPSLSCLASQLEELLLEASETEEEPLS